MRTHTIKRVSGMPVRSFNLTKASARMACVWLMQALALPCLAHAQGNRADSAYTIGPCHIRADSLVNWDAIASHVDRQARLVPSSLPLFPMGLRGTDGYSGRIVLSMVVDTLGRVEPASVSVEESTDPRLSAWGCIVALTLRYVPAVVAGKAVSSLTEHALSYNFSAAPGRP